jgi:DNA-binding transcriptional ArsR family regulator
MKNRLSPEALNQAAECLAVLAHPIRLKLVELLLEERHTVGELAEYCATPPNVTSEHLRLMQRCGFLASTRSGRFVYYTVQEPHLVEILNCIRKRFAKKGTHDARDRTN